MSGDDEGDLAIDDEEEGEGEDESLADILGSRLQPRLARALVDDICAQLAAIHARGAVHGGLEPQRVHLKEAPGHWRPRVEVVEAGAEPMNLMYSAPERQSGKFDSRADVYSVGALAHHMIVGQAPDRGGSPPSDLWPGIPGPVEALLVRLLSRDPADRPTISEAREDFAILDAPPWWKTWRAGALGGGTLAVVLLGWAMLRPAAKPPADDPEPARIASPTPTAAPTPAPTPPAPTPPPPTPPPTATPTPPPAPPPPAPPPPAPPPPTPAATVPAAAPLPIVPDARPAAVAPPQPQPQPQPPSQPQPQAPSQTPPPAPVATPTPAPPPKPPTPARAAPFPARPSASTPTRPPPPAAKPKPKPAKPRNDDSLMDPFAK